VAEGYGLQCEYGLARLVHRLDAFLEPHRGLDCAKLAISADSDSKAVCDRGPIDACDIGSCLFCRSANTNSAGITRLSGWSDVNIIGASRDISSSVTSDGNVESARCVILQRAITVGDVVVPVGRGY